MSIRQQALVVSAHGLYQRLDEDMLAIWEVAVEETRELLENDWH